MVAKNKALAVVDIAVDVVVERRNEGGSSWNAGGSSHCRNQRRFPINQEPVVVVIPPPNRQSSLRQQRL